MIGRKLLSLGSHTLCSHAVRNVHRVVGVIGVPFSKGQPRGGVAQAPQYLREAGMLRKLEAMGYTVKDYGDIQFNEIPNDPPSYNIKNPRTIGSATKRISDTVCDIIKRQETCLTLGGDHSLSIGTIHGHAQAEPNMCVIWVDAHADLNPPLASMSGNIHGMVLSFLMHGLQEYVPVVPGLEWVKPCLKPQDIAYIGLRDIDPAERYIIQTMGITCYTMHDIDRHGVDYVLEHALDAVNPGLKKPIHLSYDIDALDPAVTPSTGTPVPGGLTTREGMFIAEEISLTDRLTGVDFVEVNPQLGTDSEQAITLATAVEVMAACFGKRRTGNIPGGYELPRPNLSLADLAKS